MNVFNYYPSECKRMYLKAHNTCETDNTCTKLKKLQFTSSCNDNLYSWNQLVEIIKCYLLESCNLIPNIWYAYQDICEYDNARPFRWRPRRVRRHQRFIYILVVLIIKWLETGRDIVTRSKYEFENYREGLVDTILTQRICDREQTWDFYGMNTQIDKLMELLLQKYQYKCLLDEDESNVIISKIDFSWLLDKSKFMEGISNFDTDVIAMKKYLTEKIKFPCSWECFSDMMETAYKVPHEQKIIISPNETILVETRKYFIKHKTHIVYIDQNNNLRSGSPQSLIFQNQPVGEKREPRFSNRLEKSAVRTFFSPAPYVDVIKAPTTCFVCDKNPKIINKIVFHNGKYTLSTQEEKLDYSLHTCKSCIRLLILHTTIKHNNIGKYIGYNIPTDFDLVVEHGFLPHYLNSFGTIRNYHKIILILCAMHNPASAFNLFIKDIITHIARFIHFF